jgi:hypothetical protein
MNLTHKLSLLFVLSVPMAGCGALGAYGGAMMQPGAAANGAQPTAGSPSTPSTAGAAAPTSGASESEATKAADSGPVSVTIRSSCGKTVKVFYGEKPKFGSGTYSTASANSLSNHSFKPGEQFWIVDESQNGVANVAVAGSTKEIEILGSCDQLAAR